jgi:hypothetical protein
MGGTNSMWWRMMCGIRGGVGFEVGSWFEDNVRRVVGGGADTYFWLDNWVGGVPLRVRFPRLFDLALNKGVTVREMASRGWEVGGGTWEWRRRLLACEEDSITEFSSLLSNVVLQESSFDRRRWTLDPINGYSVKGTYKFLTMSDTTLENDLYDAAWLKQVPLKVSVFVWRLLRNRLPTKDNLLRRRVLHHDDIHCIGGCGHPETMDHLFFRCDIFVSLWYLVYQWIGINFTPPESVRDHFHQFSHLAGLPRVTYSFLQVIWHAGCWVVWKERNNRIFSEKAHDLVNLFDSVKFMSFS